MDLPDIERLLKTGLAATELKLNAEGNKLSVLIVSPEFAGLSRVKRQQRVYSLLDDRIKSGEIHAVTMRTVTPEEWIAQGAQ